jgi:hypothetical protein
MKMWMMALALLAGGCSGFGEAQMYLVEQARRGLDITRTVQTDHAQIVSQLYQLQQQRLADGFDADVRQQTALSADWIVEHRKAYAVALTALERQRAISAEAETAAQRNLAAVDAALQRLLVLQSLQLRITTLDGLIPEPASQTSGTK